MRFAACGCVPGNVATTLTISTGWGTRRAGCWMNESSSTRRRPPAARLQASSSDLIQRRAAPMPCVSESVRESVCRVWKETSLRMRASMFAAWMPCSIASTSALRAGGCAAADAAAARSSAARLALMRARRLGQRGGAVGLRPEPPVQCIEVSVDDRHDDQRQQRRGDDAADDGAAHRRLLLRAFAEAERERQHAEDHRRGGHEDRPQAHLARGDERLVAAHAAALALVREVDEQDG